MTFTNKFHFASQNTVLHTTVFKGTDDNFTKGLCPKVRLIYKILDNFTGRFFPAVNFLRAPKWKLLAKIAQNIYFGAHISLIYEKITR